MLIFDFIEIGNRLYSIRKSLGLTQAEVAEASGLSDRAYADIERGSVNMRTESVLKICQALNITPNDLFVKNEKDAAEKGNSIAELLSSCSVEKQKTGMQLLEV